MSNEIESSMNQVSLDEDDDEEILLENKWISTTSPQFISEGDKERVLYKQPWAFNKFLLILKDYDDQQSPDEIDLNFCPFWIRIHNLPTPFMNECIGNLIGSSLGKVLEIDPDYHTSSGGHYLRVRILLDTRTPLKRFKHISFENGGKRQVFFSYERLPDYCYICGMLSHQESDCLKAIKSKKDGIKVNRDYDLWLRAESASFNPLFFGGAASSRLAGDSQTRRSMVTTYFGISTD
ncbi:hypothetical protein DITRI_Ditri16bG0104600 [Diplodiscus trichospermus]